MAIMADLGASILARLKNKAKESNINYQQCLQLFFQEEFLRRLSKSLYVNNLILKGGLFLYYTLTNFQSRTTVDIDGEKLGKALKETLRNRRTEYNQESFSRILQLADNYDIQVCSRHFQKTINQTGLCP